jgi:FAD/FMN-containing dehydrogenase
VGRAVPRSIAAALADLVGARQVLVGEMAAGHERDWTGRFVGHTPCVVRPGTVDEVAAVLAWCNDRGVAVVPQGGNTGLVGGGVPLDGEVVLSLTRLDSLGTLDHDARQVTSGAGVTLGRLQDHARAGGLRFAVDLAARDSATVGGMAATNAGGLQAMAFGPMRAQLRGIQAVLADGGVVDHLGGLVKDNTGYDLAGLVCGSEGTLAVVTAARLHLEPEPAHRVTALAGFSSVGAAIAAARRVRDEAPGLEAAELFLADGLELVVDTYALPRPVATAAAYLLVEVAGAADPAEALAASLAATDPVDAAVAVGSQRRAELWRYRELLTDAIGHQGVPHKLDVSLPAVALERFVPDVEAAVSAVDDTARCWIFGHVLDGNLHVNVTGPAPHDDRVDAAVLELVAERGGSISAEHGIGRAKRRWLHLARGPVEVRAFRALKTALDPHGILNPGVLLGAASSS